ncbi:SUMF1/EgtB/PvdO family nonheme iron enzyme, partial [Mesotoga prima]
MGKGVREALISIVKEKGFSVFDNPRELESLLVNLCNDHKNEVSAILPAIREKFSDRLVEAAKTKSLSLAISDLIIILCKDYALSSEAAKWAVESLAVSLDLESEREPKNSISKDNSLRKVESEKKTTNGDYLILVMSGSFVMGNTLDNVDHVSANDEAKGDLKRQKPPHKVNLTYDFYIGRFPVTFEEYDRFCEELGIEKPNDQGWGRGKRPVIDV